MMDTELSLRHPLHMLLLIVVAVAMLGCEPSGTQAESSTTATTTRRAEWLYPDRPLPPLRKEMTKAGPRGIVTVAQVMLARTTAVDGLRVALTWRGQAQPLTKEHPLGKRVIDEDALLDGLKLHVVGPDDLDVTLEAKPRALKQRHRRRFHDDPVLLLHMTGDGLVETASSRAWTKPVPDLLERAGSYRLRLSGSLPLGHERAPFEAPELTVEVREPSAELRPISELEPLAFRARFDPRGYMPRPLGMSSLDDAEGNRWLWLKRRLYDDFHHHLLMSPSGRLIAYDYRVHDTCLAEGTRIATPHGPAPIESLRPGDALWAWDVDRDREVVTTVRAMGCSGVAPVIDIDGLRVTPNHELWTDGRWRRAGELQPDDSILRRGQGRVAVTTIELRQRTSPVYDLSVDWPHNYFAEGVLVHNKITPIPYPTDRWTWLFDRPAVPSWRERIHPKRKTPAGR